MTDFLGDLDPQWYPQLAVLAMAGPIIDDTVVIYNLPWPLIDARSLSAQFAIPFVLINDFESVAYALLGIQVLSLPIQY